MLATIPCHAQGAAPDLGASGSAPAGAPSSTASTASKLSPQDEEQVRALVRTGNDLYETGHNVEARKALLEAWHMQQSYDVASSLGLVELELGHVVDAAYYLDFSVSHFAPTESAEAFAGVKKDLAEALKHVVALNVSVDRDGARVLLDGVEVGVSPLNRQLFTQAGTHIVEARVGSQVARTSVEGKVGQQQPVRLELPRHVNAEPSRGFQPRTVALITGTAITGVAVLSGVIFSIRSGQKGQEARDLLNESIGAAGQNPCVTESSGCSRVRGALDGRNTSSNIGNWSFGIAGVAAAATVAAYLAWPTAQPESTTVSLRVTPLYAPGVGGVFTSGRF
jgi:hypothetical protein